MVAIAMSKRPMTARRFTLGLYASHRRFCINNCRVNRKLHSLGLYLSASITAIYALVDGPQSSLLDSKWIDGGWNSVEASSALKLADSRLSSGESTDGR